MALNTMALNGNLSEFVAPRLNDKQLIKSIVGSQVAHRKITLRCSNVVNNL